MADLVQRRLAVFVMHDRGAGDDAEVLWIEIPQLRDHFFGQAVAEVFLGRVSGEVLERENCNHRALARPLQPGPRTRPLKVADQPHD